MEKMQFKKFYKFVVSKPFEIQPRFPFVEVTYLRHWVVFFFYTKINFILFKSHNLKENTVLFEAQIQNITNNILFMEKVELLPIKEGVLIEEVDDKNK